MSHMTKTKLQHLPFRDDENYFTGLLRTNKKLSISTKHLNFMRFWNIIAVTRV